MQNDRESVADVLILADRVEAGSGISNALDVEIEIALFNPSEGVFTSVRSNSSSTKLVYTRQDGSEVTCWAGNWTMDRPRAVAYLRALADQRDERGGESALLDCAFVDCPPGLFRYAGMLCFKSEYSSKPGQQDAYCVDSGEYFWGGTNGDLAARRALIVTPIAALASPAAPGGVGEGMRLSAVIAEAERSLRLIEGCLECNADDERRWRETIRWLEGLA